MSPSLRQMFCARPMVSTTNEAPRFSKRKKVIFSTLIPTVLIPTSPNAGGLFQPRERGYYPCLHFIATLQERPTT